MTAWQFPSDESRVCIYSRALRDNASDRTVALYRNVGDGDSIELDMIRIWAGLPDDAEIEARLVRRAAEYETIRRRQIAPCQSVNARAA